MGSQHTSESGRYHLTIEDVPRSSGWGYTRGTVRVAAKELPPKSVAEVTRNFGVFPFLFIEDHADGHDYLLCGADYQGQTLIDLCCGTRRDYLPPEAEAGHGFCWSEYEYRREDQLLVVCGCIWACPYEYRFYDFSNPMSGWPEFSVVGDEETWLEAGDRAPEFREDGAIVCFETRREDGGSKAVVRTTLRREGEKLIVVDTWVDEDERARREESHRQDEERAAELRAYKADNAMYRRVMERSAKPPLSADPLRVGTCYENWCPDEVYNDRRLILRVASNVGRRDDTLTIDVEWGMTTAPIKVIIYKNGKISETRWFAHSLGELDAAFDFAETHFERNGSS